MCPDRTTARRLAAEALARGDAVGWFEALYQQAQGNAASMKDDLSGFSERDLKTVSFEDYFDSEDPPVRRFRVEYRRRS